MKAVPEEADAVLGTLGLLLTTDTSAPEGMLGSPVELMGIVIVPAELLVTTTTWPAVLVKVA